MSYLQYAQMDAVMQMHPEMLVPHTLLSVLLLGTPAAMPAIQLQGILSMLEIADKHCGSLI